MDDAVEAEFKALKEIIERVDGHHKSDHRAFLYVVYGDNGNKGILVRLDRLEQLLSAGDLADLVKRTMVLELGAKGNSYIRDFVLVALSSVITSVIVAGLLHFLK